MTLEPRERLPLLRRRWESGSNIHLVSVRGLGVDPRRMRFRSASALPFSATMISKVPKYCRALSATVKDKPTARLPAAHLHRYRNGKLSGTAMRRLESRTFGLAYPWTGEIDDAVCVLVGSFCASTSRERAAACARQLVLHGFDFGACRSRALQVGRARARRLHADCDPDDGADRHLQH